LNLGKKYFKAGTSYNILGNWCFGGCDKGIVKQFQQPAKCSEMRRGNEQEPKVLSDT